MFSASVSSLELTFPSVLFLFVDDNLQPVCLPTLELTARVLPVLALVSHFINLMNKLSAQAVDVYCDLSV
jgi:hypothetical protein